MLEEALGRDGHRVTTAPDGAAALERLRTGNFDAILCDLRMPRLDGPGLIRELEAIRPDLAARLLLMTGDALRAASALSPAAPRPAPGKAARSGGGAPSGVAAGGKQGRVESRATFASKDWRTKARPDQSDLKSLS